MSGARCKAAIDCTGFLYTLDRIVDLILFQEITDAEAIDDFNKMKEGFQKRVDRWIAEHVDFNAP
jgi:hypothetical protein